MGGGWESGHITGTGGAISLGMLERWLSEVLNGGISSPKKLELVLGVLLPVKQLLTRMYGPEMEEPGEEGEREGESKAEWS